MAWPPKTLSDILKVPAEIYAKSKTSGISKLEYSRYQVEADTLENMLLINSAQLEPIIAQYNDELNLESQWEETQATIRKKAWLNSLKRGKVLTVSKPDHCLIL